MPKDETTGGDDTKSSGDLGLLKPTDLSWPKGRNRGSLAVTKLGGLG